jgi:hypothetical protein
MSNKGKVMRSAKMKLTTPPKLMPPFHKAAARGTLPIEQTKLMMATNGPTTTFSKRGPEAVAVDEDVVPEVVRDEHGEEAGHDEADEPSPCAAW